MSSFCNQLFSLPWGTVFQQKREQMAKSGTVFRETVPLWKVALFWYLPGTVMAPLLVKVGPFSTISKEKRLYLEKRNRNSATKGSVLWTKMVPLRSRFGSFGGGVGRIRKPKTATCVGDQYFLTTWKGGPEKLNKGFLQISELSWIYVYTGEPIYFYTIGKNSGHNQLLISSKNDHL